MFGIERFLDRKPRQLSGGERQRVALARAVVREPVVFLLDEPLSNLDAKLRNSARDELKQFQRSLGTTTIYVTHDQAEAMGLGDRIAVLNQGKVMPDRHPARDLSHADGHLRRHLHRLAADEPGRGRRDLARLPPGGVPAARGRDRRRHRRHSRSASPGSSISAPTAWSTACSKDARPRRTSSPSCRPTSASRSPPAGTTTSWSAAATSTASTGRPAGGSRSARVSARDRRRLPVATLADNERWLWRAHARAGDPLHRPAGRLSRSSCRSTTACRTPRSPAASCISSGWRTSAASIDSGTFWLALRNTLIFTLVSQFAVAGARQRAGSGADAPISAASGLCGC